MSEHAPIAPSNMAQLVQCPGSLKMQARYPEPDGREALEGEAAHWVIKESHSGNVTAEGQITPNGVAIDEAMLDGAEIMLDLIETFPRNTVKVEQKLNCFGIHSQCWGTPDVRAWKGLDLHIADYKYGHGRVEVINNYQLMTYARGAVDEAQFDGASEHKVTVHFHIVQPRYYGDGPIRTWSVPAVDLRAHWNIATMAAEDALRDDPPTNVGPECKHCTARHACPTLQTASLARIDLAGKAEPLDLTIEQAANEKRMLEYAVSILQPRISGLDAQLLAAKRAGKVVPHYDVEFGSGRETWTRPIADVIAYGDLMGIDIRKPASAITPNQAKAKGLDLLPGFSEKRTGEAQLVPINPYKAAIIFGAKS